MLRQKALSRLTSRDAVALALQKNQSLQAARAAIDTSRRSIPSTRGGSTIPELKLGYASDRAFQR